MKKVLKIGSLLLAAVIILTVMPLNVFAVSNTLKDKTVLAFGDSLTALGAPPYVAYLSNLLGVNVINAGVGGNTTYSGYARFETDVLDKNPDVVLICFGMNDQAMDLVYKQNFMQLDNYKYYLSYFAETLLSRGCDVVFITPHPVESSTYTPDTDYTYDYQGQMDIYCNALRQVAAKYECDLIDMNYEYNLLKKSNYSTFKNYYSADGVHQNQAGREFWAEKVSEYLHAAYDNVNKSTKTVKCVDENGKTIKTIQYTGATGANITMTPPELSAYSTDNAAVSGKMDGGTVTFTYKSDLAKVLKDVEKIDVTQYSEAVLSMLRSKYTEAQILLDAQTKDFDGMQNCCDTINQLLDVKGNMPMVVSKGASYERTAPNYYEWDSATQSNSDKLNELYADDYMRLTDGERAFNNGQSKNYSAWTSDVEIVIDLKEIKKANVFTGYFACGIWGISIPAKINVSYSVDKTQWTTLSQPSKTTLLNDTDSWDTYKISIASDDVVEARYIKFRIVKSGAFVWTDEVEVALSSDAIKNAVAVFGKNGNITEKVKLFDTIPKNLAESDNVFAKWDNQKKTYVITAVNKTKTALDEGEILFAATKNTNLANAKIGQELALFGKEEMVATYFIISGEGEEYIIGDVNNNGTIDMMDYVLLKRNYFGTFAFDELQIKAGDVNNNGTIDMMDYVLLKRAYFGTFKI